MTPLPRRHILLLGLILVAGLALRLRVSYEFHAPAGDGIGYHRLAHELRAHHRYSLGPGQPLDYTREPIWPLVVAAVDTGEGNDIEHTLLWATRVNAVFDLLTALFVFLMLRELSLGWGAWLGCVLAAACPLLILDSCYLLRETLSTTIAAAATWLALRSLVRKDGRALVAAAAVVGLGMLVRFDMILLGVALLVPWARLAGWGRRLRVGAAAAGACVLVFSPWPIRNLIQFGAPHLEGAQWMDKDGVLLARGERWWTRTWVDNVHAGWLNLRITNHLSIGPRDVPPEAAASPEERLRVLAIFADYNKAGGRLTPEVDAQLLALARDRAREHPLRVLAWLPLRRAALWWWYFPPPEEQPLRSRTLHQPEWRWLFDDISHVLAIAGLAGLVALAARRRTRDAALLLALALVVRSLVMSVAGPDGGYQRYLAPFYALLLVAAAAGPAIISQRWTTRRGARTGAP